MKRGNTRPFRAPRASKPVEAGHRKDKAVETEPVEIRQTSVLAKQDSDNDDVPIDRASNPYLSQDVPIVHQIPTSFPLRKLWEYTLIPAIAQLVDSGGPCEDAIVVVQQDNAGPHIEASLSEWIRDQFDLMGWLY